MSERIEEFAKQCYVKTGSPHTDHFEYWKFAELIMQDMHRKVIASILITDVIMEEKGQKPTSEDYIQAINKDFEVES